MIDRRKVWLVLKRDVLENWKKRLNAVVGIYGVIMVVMFVQLLAVKGELMIDAGSAFESFSETMSGFIWAVLSVSMFVFASNIMRPMDTKEKRISFLMLPASRLEKYVARLVFVVFGSILSVICAVVAAELSRYLIMSVFGMSKEFYASLLPELFRVSESNMNVYGILEIDNMDVMIMKGIFWLFTFSTFILCGTIWYRNAFFKTLGLMVGVPIVLTMALFVVISVVDIRIEDLGTLDISYDGIAWAVNMFLLILTALFFMFSYMLFRKAQIC